MAGHKSLISPLKIGDKHVDMDLFMEVQRQDSGISIEIEQTSSMDTDLSHSQASRIPQHNLMLP
jgi:hypothetical protein